MEKYSKLLRNRVRLKWKNSEGHTDVQNEKYKKRNISLTAVHTSDLFVEVVYILSWSVLL
jgi:hypothetical protein